MNLSKVANQVIDFCESTNTVAKQLAEQGASHGTWVSSKRQGAGRGRLGRKWESLEGNLFLSIVARIDDRSLWSWIPLATAVAVTESLKVLFPELDFRIKWPNDLWLNQGKLGGILCEGVVRTNGAYSVIGIGINCAQSPSLETQDPQKKTEATDLTRARNGILTSADEIREPILTEVLRFLEILIQQGPDVIARIYETRSALPRGTCVKWGGSPLCIGTVIGLGPMGELQVRNAEGKHLSMFAEDVQIQVRSITP